MPANPSPLPTVGQAYRDFAQVPDAEVARLLKAAGTGSQRTGCEGRSAFLACFSARATAACHVS